MLKKNINNKNCINCQERGRCRDSSLSWIFFIIGIIATIAMRIVTVLMHINPVYGKIAWYVGVSGFFVFFMYKFMINQARSKLIEKQNIVNKINKGKHLGKKDYKLISEILCSLNSKKDRINYFFIFLLSAVALIIAGYIDFLK
ncbi:MAG: hypothetical protein ABII88_06765 [Candidatus Omnitrophota bacterium]